MQASRMLGGRGKGGGLGSERTAFQNLSSSLLLSAVKNSPCLRSACQTKRIMQHSIEQTGLPLSADALRACASSFYTPLQCMHWPRDSLFVEPDHQICRAKHLRNQKDQQRPRLQAPIRTPFQRSNPEPEEAGLWHQRWRRRKLRAGLTGEQEERSVARMKSAPQNMPHINMRSSNVTQIDGDTDRTWNTL